jgi:hypothetical protein
LDLPGTLPKLEIVAVDQLLAGLNRRVVVRAFERSDLKK